MLSGGGRKGFEAYIIREDGTRFPEHQIVHTEGSDGEPSSTSCFLESAEGSIFTVVVRVQGAFIHYPTQDWRIISYVDGRQLNRRVRSKNNRKDITESTMVSVNDGEPVEGRLVFAKLRTTDDDANVTLRATELRSVGQISVSFERGIVGRKTGRLYQRLPMQADLGVASERGKKLGGAIGSTSQKPYGPERESVKFTSHDRKEPFHRIIFNYRTRPVLELMGIVEALEPIVAPVVQAGPSAKRKRTSTSEDIKPDQKAILAARVKELERQLKEVAGLPRARVPAKVIDLTGEDSDEA